MSKETVNLVDLEEPTLESLLLPAFEDVVQAPDEPLPGYDLTFKQAYEQWKAADNAVRELEMQEPAYNKLQEELQAAEKQHQSLKKQSGDAFEAAHATKHILGILRPKNSAKERQVAMDKFQDIHSQELVISSQVESLQKQAEAASQKRNGLLSVANGWDIAWQQLQAVARRTLDDSVDLPIDHDIFTAADETFSTRDSAYSEARKKTADFTRARLTVQHSHHYLTQGLQKTDDVRGTKVGRIITCAAGYESSIFTYRDAVRYGNRAQVCLNDCLRVITPYLDSLPEDRRVDCETLKTLGTIQMRLVYEMLFGKAINADTLQGSIELQLERQETAFRHLTSLAVYIQNLVPECETNERSAKDTRFTAARELANLWLQHLAPTEGVGLHHQPSL